jgi:hypothetical protein
VGEGALAPATAPAADATPLLLVGSGLLCSGAATTVVLLKTGLLCEPLAALDAAFAGPCPVLLDQV